MYQIFQFLEDNEQYGDDWTEAKQWLKDSIHLLRCAQADLEGIMPEFEPSGDRSHPGWTTLSEIARFLEGTWCP